MSNEELKEMIKQSVREVLKEERLALYEILVPDVSKKELEEIRDKFGMPDRYSEEDFVDMTDWIKNEN